MRSLFINGDEMITKHFTKEAGYKLPEDPKKWAQAVTSKLYSTHPWLEPRSIKVTFEPKDPENGTAIGTIVIDKRYSVPLIIKDYKLSDLDVYFAGKKKKVLNKASFQEELKGTQLGTPRTPSDAEISDMSTWQQTRMPMSNGRMSLASFVDGDEALFDLESAFTEKEYSYAAKTNPAFAKIASILTSAAVNKTAAADAEYVWEVVANNATIAKTMEHGPVCMVDAAFNKVACLIGNHVIDPVSAEIGKGFWGIEANKEAPRFFLEDTPNISTHPIKTADIENYSIMAKEASDLGWHAYVVPLGESYGMVGPFMSGGVTPDGHELVSTSFGETKIAHMPGYDKPFDKFKDLFIVGNGAIKVALAAPFHPLSSSEVNFLKTAKATLDHDTLIVKGAEDILYGFKYSTDDSAPADWSRFSARLKKEAGLGQNLRRRILGAINRSGRAILRKRPLKEDGKGPYGRGNGPGKGKGCKINARKDTRKTAQLLRAAALVRPISFTTIGVDANQNLIKSAAEISPQRAEETVDSILSLGFINESNVNKFTDHVDKLDEAKEACVEMLLASRLGLSIDPSPYKIAMTALDEASRDLKQYRQVERSGPL